VYECVTAKIASKKPTVDAKSVISEAEQAFNGKYNVRTAVHYLARPDGSAALVHAIQIQNEEVNSWYEVYVDVYSGEILSATDYGA
jgi:extracellular elastinolytic metalloproteinase